MWAAAVRLELNEILWNCDLRRVCRNKISFTRLSTELDYDVLMAFEQIKRMKTNIETLAGYECVHMKSREEHKMLRENYEEWNREHKINACEIKSQKLFPAFNIFYFFSVSSLRFVSLNFCDWHLSILHIFSTCATVERDNESPNNINLVKIPIAFVRITFAFVYRSNMSENKLLIRNLRYLSHNLLDESREYSFHFWSLLYHSHMTCS